MYLGRIQTFRAAVEKGKNILIGMKGWYHVEEPNMGKFVGSAELKQDGMFCIAISTKNSENVFWRSIKGHKKSLVALRKRRICQMPYTKLSSANTSISRFYAPLTSKFVHR